MRFLLAVITIAACAQKEATSSSPPPACSSCHLDVAAAHATSRHAQAARTPEFRASFATANDRRWCLACHAKEGEAEGVGCVSCHVKGHKDRVPPSTCAGCHEFGLPPSLHQEGLSQTTVREHAAVADAPPCVQCHLDGHRFRGGHDAEFTRRALAVSVEGRSLRLHATRVGHAVPTGDPFRALVVELCADPACDFVLVTKKLTRSINGSDRRPRPGADVVVDTGGEGAADAVAWRVSIQSTEPGLEEMPATELAHGSF